MHADRASTVLLVDDALEVRYLVRMLLANVRHCRVVGEADDGVRAVELIRELKPDIVVLDFSMPRMSGLDALAEIRSLAPETRVIMYSSAPEVRDDALALGASAYLDKGTDPQQLVGLVREASLAVLDGR